MSITPLQIVRLKLDAAIAARCDKDVNPLLSGKTVSSILDFSGIENFHLLTAAARDSGDDLANELAGPAVTVINAISKMAWLSHTAADHAKSEHMQKAGMRVADQVDWALALILRQLFPFVQQLALSSRNEDLLLGVLQTLIGDGNNAVTLIERYQEVFPNDAVNADGTVEPNSLPDQFAWDAYLRVAALEKLADKFPKHVATAARQMNAWPMLRYCHSDRKKKFEQIVRILDLGADYPLDVSKRPAWRPDTPIVRYLDNLVPHFSAMGRSFREVKKWEADAAKAAYQVAAEFGEGKPTKEAIKVLIGSLALPKLIKDTAELWANCAIVPYIVVTDAKTSKSCDEPALKAIWKQQGVKSAAIFESRLTPLVVRTLKSMARP